MRHEALPQTLTVEQLAQWLYENKIDSRTHTEEIPYSEEEIREFEHKSSVASRSLDSLQELKDMVNGYLKEGIEEPQTITIPPRKGEKVLKANRKFADDQIINGGFKKEIDLYGIPHNESEQILFFDSEGAVWDGYSRDMTAEEKEQYIGLFKKEQKIDEGKEKAEETPDEVSVDENETEEEVEEVHNDVETQEGLNEQEEVSSNEAEESEQPSTLKVEKIDLSQDQQTGAF